MYSNKALIKYSWKYKSCHNKTKTHINKFEKEQSTVEQTKIQIYNCQCYGKVKKANAT